MKKIIALSLATIMFFCLAACVITENPVAKTDSTTSAIGTANTSDIEKLVEAAKKEGSLVVYGSCEEAYLSAAIAAIGNIFGERGKSK